MSDGRWSVVGPKYNDTNYLPPIQMERVVVKGKVDGNEMNGDAVVDPLSKMDGSGTVLQEADGTVWSVMLTLSDVSFGVKGHNKFYSIQIIIDDNAKHKAYVFYKWGRIGAKNPQRKLMGPMTKDAAKENFTAKFELKTENAWPLNGEFQPVPRKYTLIELDYTDDKEEEQEENSQDNDIPPSNLPPSVEDFVKMICDIDLIEQEMAEMHLDLKRMPLGKLSKQQINKGYDILDQISETLHAMSAITLEKQEEEEPEEKVTTRRRSGRKKGLPSKAKQQLNKYRAQLKELSSEFYTLVPHDFGMNLPPLIDSLWEIKLKLDLLEVLFDVEITQKLIKEKKSVDVNPVDAHYASFNTHMECVDPTSDEFKNIEEYIALTHAPTHRQYKLKVESIHRVS
ncbi:poly, ADP-ribose polymerase, partial [Thraustotheca clavata]